MSKNKNPKKSNDTRTPFSQGKPEEIHVKIAHILDEVCKLLEVSFEYVTDINWAKLFRKRK